MGVGVKESWPNIGGSYRWTPVLQGDLPQCELVGPCPPSLGCSQGPDNHWSYKTRYKRSSDVWKVKAGDKQRRAVPHILRSPNRRHGVS